MLPQSASATQLHIQATHSAKETDPEIWDKLGADISFASHRWQLFAEKTMTGCKPFILTVYDGSQAVARAILWKVPNEPLPISSWVRPIIMKFLEHNPLLICRAAYANQTSFICADQNIRKNARNLIAEESNKIARKEGCSAVLFDFIAQEDANDWPKDYITFSMDDRGTKMSASWKSMAEYMASKSAKRRRHYKQTLRDAAEMNLEINVEKCAPNPKELIPLIRAVENRYGSPYNEWLEATLTHMEMVHGLLILVRQNGKTVGCGISLDDRGTQITTGLGIAPGLSNVYLVIIYKTLEVAFEKGLHTLRWGAGAYDLKQHLGFELENTNLIKANIIHPVLKILAKISGF